MKILLACEVSGIVRDCFKVKGHDAWSCDILPTDTPGQHIQGDVLNILNDGWNMMIAFPPCTYLTVTANRWHKPEFKDKFPTREKDRMEAIEFFMALANAPIDKIVIENPVGIMSSRWRKPDQIIQPWQFGEPQVKKTCLWITRNLPLLKPTNIVEPLYKEYNSSTKKSGKSKYPILWTGKADAKERSKTFRGIAKAMSEQWG